MYAKLAEAMERTGADVAESEFRRELFLAAGDFFRALERDCGFRPEGLNPIQRLLYMSCLNGCYRVARCVAGLT